MNNLFADKDRFIITVEVLPPEGADAGPLLDSLQNLEPLSFDAFSIASNPVARPRMSAMAACRLIRERAKRKTILHMTVRDQNRISIQGELWGARALGIEALLLVTGDPVPPGESSRVSNVSDVDIFSLIDMSREAGLFSGVVFDSKPEVDGFDRAVRRLEEKVRAGAQFVVTQPVFTGEEARIIYDAIKDLDIPLLLGVLPLRSIKHAEFLNNHVSGIAVPRQVRERMAAAKDPVAEGIAHAREMLDIAGDLFRGACVMPPINHFEVLHGILASFPSPRH